MPLLKWKKNIWKNIHTEMQHGKKHNQAIAIAMRVAKIPMKPKRKMKDMEMEDIIDKKKWIKESMKEDMGESEKKPKTKNKAKK